MEKFEYTKEDGTKGWIRTNNFCIDCNKPLTMDGQERCRKCNSKARIKVREQLKCKYCNIAFEKLKCQISGENIFCSVSCGTNFRLEKYRTDGKRRLSFRKAIKRSVIYKETLIKCYQRDSYKCVKCTSTSNIQCHHIVYFSKLLKEFLEENNSLNVEKDKERLLQLSENYSKFWDLSNLITFCKECHQLEHPNLNLNSKRATKHKDDKTC